jgi:hypothetical protein
VEGSDLEDDILWTVASMVRKGTIYSITSLWQEYCNVLRTIAKQLFCSKRYELPNTISQSLRVVQRNKAHT